MDLVHRIGGVCLSLGAFFGLYRLLSVVVVGFELNNARRALTGYGDW